MLTLFTVILGAQAVYVPPSHDVYDLLSRFEARGLLPDYRDAARPLSRLAIADHLRTIGEHRDILTTVERERYEFFLTEFQYELLTLEGDPEPSETRWHVLSYPLAEGIMNLDVNFGVATAQRTQGTANHRVQGIRIGGYAYKDLGYAFNLVDHRETGEGIDRTKMNTREPGVVLSRGFENSIEYDEVDAQLSLRLGAVDLTVGKLKNEWGYGPQGSVIFSPKAPSYAQVLLRFPLSEDVDFVYFHGELNSDEIDSLRSYTQTYLNSAFTPFRQVDKLKYIAAHQIEISVVRGVDLSLGESIVYSDRGPLLIYMIPIMFFKAAEHYNRDKDNSQIFGSLDLNVIRNVNAQLSVFIDEINTDMLTDPYKSRRQLGVSGGIHLYDLPVANMEVVAQYARCNPWVYNHKYPAVSFANNGYPLGHWIGQNADLLMMELSYRPIRALKVSAFTEINRKGGKADPAIQYTEDGGKLSFLYGPSIEKRTFGLTAWSEPLRDLYLRGFLRWNTVRDETRTGVDASKSPEFGISAQLGIW